MENYCDLRFRNYLTHLAKKVVMYVIQAEMPLNPFLFVLLIFEHFIRVFSISDNF
jgi:hypothetical protein